ncbi:MAG: HlyD family secretion protein [Dokdonia sp.]|jgi:HlyD family secretion protein
MKACCIVILFTLFVSCDNSSKKTYPEYRPLHIAIYASATVQPDSMYEVYSNAQGILQQNLVTEGDIVTLGTPIAQLIDSKSQLEAENAKLLYKFSQKQYGGNTTLLNTIEQEISVAELKVQDDSIHYSRQERLWNKNIGSKAQFEAKKLLYITSQKNLQTLKIRLDRTKDELENHLNTAQNKYKTAISNTEDYTIKSSIHGKIYALYKNPGESISAQTPIALLGSSDRFTIEMLVDEVDIVSVKIDQEIVLTLDAYPNTLFGAIVHKIYPAKNVRNQTFLVEGRFTQQPSTLYPGLAGEANIIIQQKDSTLVIPKKYLIHNNQVHTKNGTVSIVKGLENMEYVEIVSGLQSTTEIILPKQ